MLEWSKERPTKPGFYFTRVGIGLMACEVRPNIHGDGLVAVPIGLSIHSPIETWDCEWLPIPSPDRLIALEAVAEAADALDSKLREDRIAYVLDEVDALRGSLARLYQETDHAD